MIVKLCAPGILPDPGTLDVSVMQMPRKGDTLVIHTGPDDVEQLVVKRVVWTFEAPADRSTLYHDVPELVCERAEDVGDGPDAIAVTFHDPDGNEVEGSPKLGETLSVHVHHAPTMTGRN